MTPLLVAIVGIVGACVLYGRVTRFQGWLAGLAEAERRNRLQQQHDYERGRTDAIREGILSAREEQP